MVVIPDISSTLIPSGTVTCRVYLVVGVPDVLRKLHFFLREAQSIYKCLMPDLGYARSRLLYFDFAILAWPVLL